MHVLPGLAERTLLARCIEPERSAETTVGFVLLEQPGGAVECRGQPGGVHLLHLLVQVALGEGVLHKTTVAAERPGCYGSGVTPGLLLLETLGGALFLDVEDVRNIRIRIRCVIHVRDALRLIVRYAARGR